MIKKWLFWGEASNPEVERYKRFRKLGKDLATEVITQYGDEKSFNAVAKILGIKQGKSLLLESEEEINFLMDLLLYEYDVAGKTFIQRYLADNTALEDATRELLEAGSKAYTSLFKIVATQPQASTVTLKNLLTEQEEIQITDISMSKSIAPNHLIFTRIVTFSDFNMSSGMYCIFPPESEPIILKRYPILMRKVKSDDTSIQRLVAFFKLNRTEGLQVLTRNV